MAGFRRIPFLLRLAVATLPLLVGSLAMPRLGEANDLPAALTPLEYADEAGLLRLLWVRSPEVLAARQVTGEAASELAKARQYPNPSLDFTWGTIPVGASNPANLSEPLTNVPNYSAGVSELFEIGKRGPRQAAATDTLERSRQTAREALIERYFELRSAIARIALSQARAGMLAEQLDSSAELLDLEQARASKGEIAQIDVERATVEHLRLGTKREAALIEQNQAMAGCAALVGLPCSSFDTDKVARGWLEREAAQPLPAAWAEDFLAKRADVAAIEAGLRAAEERQVLARRRAIPDVTVRAGYTYDTFQIAGNQRNSLALGVSLPLPVFDRGQADLQQAIADAAQLRRTRDSVAQSARLSFEAAVRRRELVAKRLAALDDAVGRARSLRDSLEEASRRGGASLTDVLLARRGYQELLLERTDLTGESFDAALDIRRAGALLPELPETQQESSS